MKPYEIRFTKEAVKDASKLSPHQQQVLKNLLRFTIAPSPQSGKKLVGDLQGFYSVRLSYKDRIVYSIDEDTHTVFVHRARTHYGK